MSEKEDLVIKRVINADIYLILDTSVIKALHKDRPIDITVEGKKDLTTIRQAIETEGKVRFRLIKKAEETKEEIDL